MNIRTALILLLELVLTVGVIAGGIWVIERFMGRVPDLVKIGLAIVLVLLFLIFLVGGGRPPLITW